MSEITIQIPIHPDDRDLPLSVVQIRLPSGKIAAICIPIQGEKTIDNALAVLRLWKPTIVVPDLEFQI